MHARLRKNSNCGCTLAELMFLVALHLYWKAHYANRV